MLPKTIDHDDTDFNMRQSTPQFHRPSLFQKQRFKPPTKSFDIFSEPAFERRRRQEPQTHFNQPSWTKTFPEFFPNHFEEPEFFKPPHTTENRSRSSQQHQPQQPQHHHQQPQQQQHHHQQPQQTRTHNQQQPAQNLDQDSESSNPAEPPKPSKPMLPKDPLEKVVVVQQEVDSLTEEVKSYSGTSRKDKQYIYI